MYTFYPDYVVYFGDNLGFQQDSDMLWLGAQVVDGEHFGTLPDPFPVEGIYITVFQNIFR